MSNELVTIIESMQPSFEKVNTEKLPFHKETEFALQIIEKSDFLTKVALGNKQSFRNAIVNVAAVGLSLNPALKLAYLVPRKVDGAYAICLDISYMGLARLLTDSGAVRLIRAEVVYEKDHFEYQGPFTLPVFKPDCWADERGSKKGVWAAIKTLDGDYSVGFMSLKEVYKIRDRCSESYKAHVKEGKTTPWVTDEDEMIKKTIIKRDYKLWPKTERLAKAIEVLNIHEGIDFEKESTQTVLPSESKLDELKSKLVIAKKTEKALLASLPDHKCQTLEELDADQVAYSIRLLDQLISSQKGAK